MCEEKNVKKQEEPEEASRQFSDEELEQVTGGKSPFADIPRVPVNDYDEKIKENI